MPPTSGAGFAQFFPAAPRAARDRATAIERERATSKQQQRAVESPGSRDSRFASPSLAAPSGRVSADDDLVDGMATPGRAAGLATAYLSAVTSASNPNPPSAGSSYLTPLTGDRSPSHLLQYQPTSAAHRFDMAGDGSHLSKTLPSFSTATSPSHQPPLIPTPPSSSSVSDRMMSNGVTPPDAFRTTNGDRVPARDPHRRVQGVACVYDPLLPDSKSAASSSLDLKRKGKPVLKEFGMVCTASTHYVT